MNKMNKKFAPVILVVVLASLAVGVSYWRGQGEITLPFARPVTDAQNQVTQPTVNTPAPISTADWKTYRNEVYGYSIRYPANWEIIREDKKRATEFSPVGENYYLEGEPEIGVVRVVVAPDVKFDKLKYSNTQQIVVDSQMAYKNIYGYGGEVSVDFDISGVPISLVNDVSPAVINSENRNKASEYNQVFDIMLSTFKFVK